MTLALTALRLAAIEALRSHPAIAAACPDRVFDSRMASFESSEPVPTIVVTTEEISGDALSANNGGLPFRDTCDLNLEIALSQFVEVEGDPAIFRPETDKEQEASLNLLGWCAEQILTTGRPHPLARPTTAGQLLIRAVTRRVLKRHVTRFASDESGEKLAIHLVTFRIELKTETPDARAVPMGPFAGLPDPLRTVAESLTPGSSGRLVCQMIADAIALPAPTPLQAARINPAGTATPVPADPVPSLTIPLAESP